MQVAWPLLLLAIACSAPAKPAVQSKAETVGALERVVANDCPSTKLGPWNRELFPACGFFPVGLPICVGSTCAPACSMSGGDYSEQYTYDGNGRFSRLVYNGTPYVSCEYDGEHMSRCAMGDERVRAVTRDQRGRIVSLDSGDDRMRVTYDAEGRVASIGDETFRYDDRGWLVAMGSTTYEHDAAGHVTKETKGASVITFEYEGDRLARMLGPGPHRSASFVYDDKGRLSGVNRGGLEGQGVGSTVYHYDCK